MPSGLKYLFINNLEVNGTKNNPEINAKPLIYRYLTAISLFLKDLAPVDAKPFILKDRSEGGQTWFPSRPMQSLYALRKNSHSPGSEMGSLPFPSSVGSWGPNSEVG